MSLPQSVRLPSFPRMPEQLGEMARHRIEALQNAVKKEVQPAQKAQLLAELAQVYEEHGQWGAAARYLVEAHRLTPDDRQVIERACRVYTEAGQWAGVVHWLRQSVRLSSDPKQQARLLLQVAAACQDHLGDFEQAQVAMSEARAHDPDVFAAPRPEASTPPPPTSEPGAAPVAEAPPTPGPVPQPPAPASPTRRLAALKVSRNHRVLAAVAAVLLVGGALIALDGGRLSPAQLPRGFTCPPDSEPAFTPSEPARGADGVYSCRRSSGNGTVGASVLVSSTGKVRRATYEGGVLQGHAEEIEGDLLAMGSYLASARTGAWSFLDGGVVIVSANYVRGVLEGQRITHFPDGGTWRTETWSAGILQGPAAEHYPSGGVRESGSYVAGKRQGAWFRYSEPGELVDTWEEPRTSGVPRAASLDAGSAPEVVAKGDSDDLYAGQPLSYWRVRLSDAREQARLAPATQPLLDLTLLRAERNGLVVDPGTGRLQARVRVDAALIDGGTP